MNFTGKVALVTGAANGIGRAIAVTLAKYGAKLILADIVEAVDTAKIIEKNEGQAISVIVDVTSTDSINRMVQEVVAKMGKIDILANNAGIYNNGMCLEYTEKQWDALMNINLKGAFFVAQAVANQMVKTGGGKIVNTSSQAGKSPELSNVGYCIAKRGIVAMTQVMAMELAQHNINVNAVCPGITETRLLINSYAEKSAAYGKTIDVVKRELCEEIPLKRPGKPEEIGELVAFLASDKANYITGESVIINGGKMME